MFSCRRNDAEEKPRQKEGHGRRLVTVLFWTRIIVSVLVQESSASTAQRKR